MTRGHTETEWRLAHWHMRELWLALARLSPDWSQTPWEKLPENERWRLGNTWGVIVSLMNHHEELTAAEDPIEQINAELSEKLVAACVAAILDAQNITLCIPIGCKWPKGFPRGELLSESASGRNFSFDPIKVLRHIQKFVLRSRAT